MMNELTSYSAEHQALRTVAESLARAPEAAIPLLLQQAQEVCGADWAGVTLLAADGAPLFRQIEGNPETPPNAWDAFWIWAAQLAAPQVFHDVHETPLGAWPDPQIQAVAAAPIVHDEASRGVFWIASPRPRPEWGENELAFLADLGNLALAAWRLNQTAAPWNAASQPFCKIFEEGPLGMAILGLDGRVLQANQVLCELTGFTPDELRERTLGDLAHPQDAPRERRCAEAMLAGGRPSYQLEGRLLHRDGGSIWVSHTCLAMQDSRGRVLYGLSMVGDIRQRKQAEAEILAAQRELEARVEQRTAMLRVSNQALRESELRFRALFDRTFQFVGLLALGGEILILNQTALDFTGESLDDLEGRPLWRTRWWESNPAAQEAVQTAIRRAAAGEFIRYEVEVRGAGDRTATLDFSLKPVQDDLGETTLLILEGRDITQYQQLQREVLQIAAEEQRRIGQELHDGTGQELTGLGYLAQALAEQLAAQGAPEAALAQRVSDGLRASLKQVRVLARGLIPVQVDAQGLMAALSEFAGQCCANYGLRCTFECREPVAIADNATATHLFRIAQEATTNAAKHAQCDHVVLRLQDDRDAVRLSIADNGVGISPETENMPGVGLRIMHYRASLIGATLAVAPGPQGGTVVTCTLRKDKFSGRTLSE